MKGNNDHPLEEARERRLWSGEGVAISLLSTLGKAMEATIAERKSCMVEAHGIVPANHFGAPRRWSAKQALLLLQEQIYNTWRVRKMLSLVSLVVKGAYNGVC